MIELVGISDSIAKCEKSDVLAWMLIDKNTPKFRGRGKRNYYLGVIMSSKLCIFGIIRKVLEGPIAWC